MSNLTWQTRRNLENSFVDFLTDEANDLTIFYKGSNQAIDIRVGNTPQDDWTLPNISIYIDSKTAPRAFVGQNRRLESFLMIIDIRALDDGMRADLAEWVATTINDGFDIYEYDPNSGTPDSPFKALNGKASIDFVSDTAIRSTEDANLFEKFRHRITCNISIAE